MQILFHILIFCVATYIAIQDFRDRTVTVFSLVALAIILLADSLIQFNFYSFVKSTLFNAGFISLVLILLTIVFSIKEKRLCNILDTYIGNGDVLLFYILAFSMETINFILFFIISMFIAPLLHLVLTKFKIDKRNEIPLASVLMITFNAFLVFTYLLPGFSLNDNQWFNQFLLTNQ